jgi:hypothetical protein
MINEKLIPQYKKWLPFKHTIYRHPERQVEVCLWTKAICNLRKTMDHTAMTPDEIHQLGLNEVAFNCRNGKVKKLGFEGTL